MINYSGKYADKFTKVKVGPYPNVLAEPRCSRIRGMFLGWKIKNSDSSWAYIMQTCGSLWSDFLKQTRRDLWKCLELWISERATWHDLALWRQCKAASVPLVGRTSEERPCHTFSHQAQDSAVHKQHVSLCQFVPHNPTTQPCAQ